MKRIILFLLLFTCIGILSQINVSASELISSEMIELRTANSKTFQTDDGNGKMVLYNHDIHFFENSKYNDIDMSLVKNKNTYQTKNSNYQISLPETLTKGNLIEVKHQDSSIKFYYPNSIESNFSISNDLGSKGLEKAQSQLTYQNIKNNTDLDGCIYLPKNLQNYFAHQHIHLMKLCGKYLSMTKVKYSINMTAKQYTLLLPFKESGENV